MNAQSAININEEKIKFLTPKQYLLYGGIIVASLGMGIYEGAKDTSWMFRVAELGVPVLSGYLALRTELSEEYSLDFGPLETIEEKGW